MHRFSSNRAVYGRSALGAEWGHYHWQAPGYLILFPLLASLVVEKLKAGHAATLRWLLLSIAALLVIIAVIGTESVTGWAHMLLKNSLRPERDFTVSGLEWKELRTAIAERHLLDERRLFVVTAHRVEIGKVDLELGKFLPVVCMCGEPRNIAFGWNLDNFLAWDALIIGTDARISNALHAYGSYFRNIEPLDNVDIHRGGRVVLTLRVYYAKHYLGSYPLPFVTSPRRVLGLHAGAALMFGAAAEPVLPPAVPPKTEPAKVKLQDIPDMVFYIAKGDANACGHVCDEWIARRRQDRYRSPPTPAQTADKIRQPPTADLLPFSGRCGERFARSRPVDPRAKAGGRCSADHSARLRSRQSAR
jgi:hypothetical protein